MKRKYPGVCTIFYRSSVAQDNVKIFFFSIFTKTLTFPQAPKGFYLVVKGDTIYIKVNKRAPAALHQVSSLMVISDHWSFPKATASHKGFGQY